MLAENTHLQKAIILLVTIVVTSLLLIIARWLLLARNKTLDAEQRLPRQLTMLLLWIIAVVAIILSLPTSESSRNQLLALFGVLLSGVIAFSSTTIVTNLMAGLILRLNKPFRAGDYIRCQDYAGRVSESGLLDTEIQTEQRALVHIANSYLINHPVEVIRSSGTLINAEVSLGYDIHHARIQEYLLKAAENAGLDDAFVRITALGDYSVNYKIAGLLLDTKSMLTAQSRLHACILDELHIHNIEIMSPKIMAPRQVDPQYAFIPKPINNIPKKTSKDDAPKQEDVAFDKAHEAEKYVQQRHNLELEITQLKARLSQKDNSDAVLTIEQKDQTKAQITALEETLLALTEKYSLDKDQDK